MVTKVQLVVITLIVGALTLILYGGLQWGLWNMIDVNQLILYIVGTGIVGTLAWGFGDAIKNRLEKKPANVQTPKPSMSSETKNSHLSVVYLRRKGFPDSPEYTLKRYITNEDVRRAYLIRELPEWLASDIIEHKIDWRGFNDTSSFNKFLDSNYSIVEIEPLRADLRAQTIEFWKVEAIIQTIKRYQLKDLCPLENLEVRTLSRKHFNHVAKRALIIYSPNDGSKAQAWLAPSYIYALVRAGLIEENSKNMRFWQSCPRWAKDNGYTFVDRFYPFITLLSKSTVTSD